MSAFLQAIVFDYDGVLADTEALHLRAFQDTLASEDLELSRGEYFEHCLGLDDEGVFRAFAERHGLDWSKEEIVALVSQKAGHFGRRLAEACATSPQGGQRSSILFPGVVDRLRAWRGQVLMGVASGSLREEIEPVLAAEGVGDAIEVIVAAGETPRGKPSPDPYARALALLAARLPASQGPLDSSRCLAVEDSPWGVDSAHAAGMKVVAVATSYPAGRLHEADLVVERFEDLDLEDAEALVCRAPRARR